MLEGTKGCVGDVPLEKAAVDVIDIWLLGLVVWFSLKAGQVPGSIPGAALDDRPQNVLLAKGNIIKLVALFRSPARVLAMQACPARFAEYPNSSIANSLEIMKQKRKARRPQVAGRIVPLLSEARQFGRVV